MRRVSLALVLCTLFALPAWAQEQRGTIEGSVKDAQGGVLPGATVEARSTGGAVVSSTTNDTGTFRFPSLLPGIYDVTVSLSGFTGNKFDKVEVALGQIKRLDFTLSVAGVTEQVQVTAESPLVDVRQSARSTSIRSEQIDLIPKGRDFSTLVTLAPGANNEAKLGGISIDGSSAGENRFIIDGIETTDLQDGTQGQGLLVDFIEEVQVKSSGYPAEYGGATGGVINVLTKSGTNNWRGTALFNWQGDKLAGERRPTLRLKPTDSNVAEYITYPKDTSNRVEPAFSIGGPIASDKAWFFGAYQPAFTSEERTVTLSATGQPISEDRKLQVQYLTANQTAQISDKLRTRVAYNNSWSKTDGRLPALDGSDPAGAPYGDKTTFPSWSTSGSADYVASSSFFIGTRLGYSTSDVHQTGIPSDDRLWFPSSTNIGFVGTNGVAVPASFQRQTGFASIPSNSSTTYDQQSRLYFQTDATWYANVGGQHTVKGGMQIDRVGNKVLSGEQGNLVRFYWGSTLGGERGPFGYYRVRSNGVNPNQGFITEGDVSTTNLGFFIQDAWTVNNRLTVNLGVRTERERVPAFSKEPGIPQYGVEFSFKDKFAPRFGAAYDIKGDGKWKIYGSWGVFYDIFKLELPRGSFGGDKWLEYYYTLDTFDFTSVAAGASCPPACNGRLLRGPVDFRHPSFGSDAIDPDLKPMKLREAAAGLEHQLSPVMALSVRYVHKQIIRAIEDTGSVDADSNEIYVIANPGFGLTALAFPGVPLPKAVRDYDGVEFTFDKRFADNWSLRSSYLWSRLHGNYSGLSQSDEDGRTSPNIGRVFDHPLMMFDEKGRPVLGPLATDRPHQFKTQVIYQYAFGTSIGLNAYIASGLPVTREIAIIPPNFYPVQYKGRGSDGRTPLYSQTDLLVSHEFKLAGRRALQLNFNILNLFNQETAISRFSTEQKAGEGVIVTEAAIHGGNVDLAALRTAQRIGTDPRFLQDNAFQAPIQARFGVKFIF